MIEPTSAGRVAKVLPHAPFLKKNSKTFSFLKKKICNTLSLEKHRESAKGAGRELGRQLEGNWERERELEKHSTSFTLKKRNWKNTAFSITPGKGNWKRELEKGTGSQSILNDARERELEKHSIFNHAQERELEKPRNCNHA